MPPFTSTRTVILDFPYSSLTQAEPSFRIPLTSRPHFDVILHVPNCHSALVQLAMPSSIINVRIHRSLVVYTKRPVILHVTYPGFVLCCLYDSQICEEFGGVMHLHCVEDWYVVRKI